MKSLLDRSFKYRRACETDIGETFKRIRREQEAARKRQAENAAEAAQKVKPIVKGKVAA